MLEVLDAYGYSAKRNPFLSVSLKTADLMKVGRLTNMAIEAKRIIAIVGRCGIGKTWAINAALKGVDAYIVHCEKNSKERMLIEDIEKDLIRGLTDGNEKHKRDSNVRAAQLRRIMGEAARKKPIILIIEEAHRLHGQTIRSLKTLMEKDWMGMSPLFTPILVAQYNPLNKTEVTEVRLRADAVQMHGVSAEEARQYITDTVGRHFESDAVDAVSRLEQSRNFLELQGTLIALMERALQAGRRIVSVIDVLDLYGGGIKEIMARTKVEASDLVRETGLSKATVSLIVNDREDKLSPETFNHGKGVISDYLQKKLKLEENGDKKG